MNKMGSLAIGFVALVAAAGLVVAIGLALAVNRLETEVATAQEDIRTLEGGISFLADTRPLDTVPDRESMICGQQTAPQPTGSWTLSLTCAKPERFAYTTGTFPMNDPRLDGRDLRCRSAPTPTPTTSVSRAWDCYEKP